MIFEYGIGIAALSLLGWFMRAQSKRQDELFGYFTTKLNGSLEGVRDALYELTAATEHNTRSTQRLVEEINKPKRTPRKTTPAA